MMTAYWIGSFVFSPFCVCAINCEKFTRKILLKRRLAEGGLSPIRECRGTMIVILSFRVRKYEFRDYIRFDGFVEYFSQHPNHSSVDLYVNLD